MPGEALAEQALAKQAQAQQEVRQAVRKGSSAKAPLGARVRIPTLQLGSTSPSSQPTGGGMAKAWWMKQQDQQQWREQCSGWLPRGSVEVFRNRFREFKR